MTRFTLLLLFLFPLKSFAQTETEGELSHRLYPPSKIAPSEKYPLIVVLHGAGGGGNRSLMRTSFQEEHPCFVLVPKTKGTWENPKTEDPKLSEEDLRKYSTGSRKLVKKAIRRIQGDKPKELLRVIGLVEKYRKEKPIDSNRVYVLGHSMGGMGSWYAIWERPDLFAAAIPSSGVLPLWLDRKRFLAVPVWAFHGGNDRSVPTEGTRDLFASMKELGGNMKYTELKGEGHMSNRIAFAFKGDDPEKGFITQYSSDSCDKTPDVWEWLFRQNLSDRR